MGRSISAAIILGSVLVVGACKKGEDSKKEETAASPKGAEPVDTATAKAKANATDKAPTPASSETPAEPGVTAGGIQRDASEGPAAVATAVKGTVEVRRVGETAFAAAAADTKLYPGDQVRTGDASTATITLADESVIEVAEISTVAIASRQSTADPASGAAVLAGLARFTVTSRAPGEGAFHVYTPAGVVMTRGTVYGIGVAASGQVRVGVESGAVDVIGLAAFDAKPILVDGGSAAVIQANGTVAAPVMWPVDDWGAWRDETDAKIEVGATVDAHGAAMDALRTQIVVGYNDLDAAADSVATFEANASASADKGDIAAYEASLPDGAATIDASFNLAGQLEALTWAHASHATLATDLYVRHPDTLKVQWEVVGPRVDAAVLWPKRYEVTASGYLEPLRLQYYVHHPRGRVHAPLVGVAVPEFYAKVDPPEIDAVRVRGRVKTKIWIAPEVAFKASPRPVWVSAPPPTWRADVKVAPAPFRADVGWYVRPPSLKAKVLVGGDLRGRYDSRLVVAAPEPRAKLRARWTVPVGVKIKVGAPNVDAGVKARASWKVGAGGQIRDHRAKVDAPDVRGKVVVKVPVPEVRVQVPAVRAKIGVNVRDHRDGAVQTGGAVRAKANAGVKVKVKAPQIKIKAPSLKVKAKGSFRIGG